MGLKTQYQYHPNTLYQNLWQGKIPPSRLPHLLQKEAAGRIIKEVNYNITKYLFPKAQAGRNINLLHSSRPHILTKWINKVGT